MNKKVNCILEKSIISDEMKMVFPPIVFLWVIMKNLRY